MHDHANYLRIYATFLRNSLVRDMQFRGNFLVECISSMSWVGMNIGFYLIVFQYTNQIGPWHLWEFFVFLATTLLVFSTMQAFFMPNASYFSELIRTGGLDFLLLKPVDVQFMVSLQRVSWASMANFFVGLVLLIVSLWKLTHKAENPLVLEPAMFVLYPFYVLCGIVIMYSLMISLAATSIWLGRNQSLYDFWFYLTNFSRYPMEIYGGNALGTGLRWFFTFIVPILVVVNVPARILAQPLRPASPADWWLPAFALLATVVSVVASRWVFSRALLSYRSASS